MWEDDDIESILFLGQPPNIRARINESQSPNESYERISGRKGYGSIPATCRINQPKSSRYLSIGPNATSLKILPPLTLNKNKDEGDIKTPFIRPSGNGNKIKPLTRDMSAPSLPQTYEESKIQLYTPNPQIVYNNKLAFHVKKKKQNSLFKMPHALIENKLYVEDYRPRPKQGAMVYKKPVHNQTINK